MFQRKFRWVVGDSSTLRPFFKSVVGTKPYPGQKFIKAAVRNSADPFNFSGLYIMVSFDEKRVERVEIDAVIIEFD